MVASYHSKLGSAIFLLLRSWSLLLYLSLGKVGVFLIIPGADLECKTKWWPIFAKLILFILQLLFLFLLLLL